LNMLMQLWFMESPIDQVRIAIFDL
jgi:hypothetical protein